MRTDYGPRTAPVISVIVPVYNCERFLTATLRSIQAQTDESWEAIVVDDGSDDASATIAARFTEEDKRFRLIRQANGGASAARNAGFRASHPNSSYVTFMDSDDIWLPGAVQTLRERLEASPSAVGSHGLAEFIDETGQIIDEGFYSARGRRRLGGEGRRLVLWPLERPTTFEVLINGNVLFPPGLLLVRRSVYEAVGPFDQAFKAAEDWDMLIRLSRYGPIEFVDRVILHYRRHEANLGATDQTPRSAWLVRCKAFHSRENSHQQRVVARRGWRAYQVMMAAEAWRAAVAALRIRRFDSAIRQLARIGVSVARWLRGYPLPRVRSEPRRW